MARPKDTGLPDAWQKGAAEALAFVLQNHGIQPPSQAQIINRLSVSRSASSLLALMDVARDLGLQARLVKLGPDDARYLVPPAIVRLDDHELAVVTAVRGDGSIVLQGDGESDRKLSRGERAGLTFRRSEFLPGAPGKRLNLTSFALSVLGGSSIMARAVLMAALANLLLLFVPVLTGIVVDRVLPRRDYHLYWMLALLSGPLLLFHLMAGLMRVRLVVQLRSVVDLRLCAGFVDHLLSLPFSFFQSRSPGDLVGRLNSNYFIREMLTLNAINAALDLLMACIYLFALFVSSPIIGGVALLFAAAQVLVFFAVRRQRADTNFRLRSALRQMQTFEHEMVNNIESIRCMHEEARVVNQWSNHFTRLLNIQLGRWGSDWAVEAMLATLRLAAPVAVLAVGAWMVLQAEMSLGRMLSVVVLGTGFLVPVGSLIHNLLSIQTLQPILERVRDVLEAPPAKRGEGAMLLPLRGDIRLEKVSVSFGTETVLHEVSLAVSAQDYVAVVGRTGAGKSTLLRAMAGLITPASGRILLDGVDLGEADGSIVRAQSSTVTQVPTMFSGTLRDNITLFDPCASTEDVIAAARQAAIHEEIVQLPGGYDTVIGAEGRATLSGGQRQRIAIARALYRRPRLLLLDEATNAVDAITELQIQKAIEGLSCTRVVVAHRLSTIRNARWIIVLRDGRVVESGTHQELLDKRGEYAAMCAAQTDQPSKGVSRSVDAPIPSAGTGASFPSSQQ